MADAPQGGPTGHAQGAHPAPIPAWTLETFDQTGREDPVQQPPNPALSEAATNIVEQIDITKIGNDRPDDSDYDDPYPGGPAGTLGVPGDG